MYKSETNTAIQAVPLYHNKINKGAGIYEVENIIHAETDTSLILNFPQGNISYTLKAGEDRSYKGNVTVVTGTITYS